MTTGGPWWTDYVELTLELGISVHAGGGTVGLWGSGKWDDVPPDLWSGLEPDWLVVNACNVLDVATTRGRDRWIERFGPSSASVTIQDPEGNLSWDSATDDDQLEVRPGTELRLTARVVETGATFPVWRGWIESIEDEFAPSAVPVAKFVAQDGYAQLAHINLLEVAPVGAGETSDARVSRLLDLAAWPAAWRDIHAGKVTVQGTNLARPIADDLGITADSEGGAVFADRTGRIAFRDRDWMRTDPHATAVQATVGGDAQDVCASFYATTRDAGDIVNDVQFARAGGTMIRYVDNASISRYRQRTYQRSDFVCETDDQVGVLARRVLTSRAGGQVRLPRLVITPTDDAAAWEFVLAVDYGWRLEVHYPTTDGTDWIRTVVVQGVAHRVTVTGWETELRVDDVGSAVATWDRARWDRALWTEVA